MGSAQIYFWYKHVACRKNFFYTGFGSDRDVISVSESHSIEIGQMPISLATLLLILVNLNVTVDACFWI